MFIELKLRTKLLLLPLLFYLMSIIISGCVSTDLKKAIYDNNAKIVEAGDSYSYLERIGEADATHLALEYKYLNGAQTLWYIECQESTELVFDFDLAIQSGDLKVVLITPKDEIIKIAESSKNGSYSVTTTVGKYRVKVVGKHGEGKIEINLKSTDKANVKVADGFSTKTEDPKDEKRGSSSGNIVNGGLMGGEDSFVYYRSEADNWKLYRANLDGTSKQKISDDIPSNINVLDGWIYFSNYSDGHKLYKIKADGTQKTKLTDCQTKDINVIGDTIYYVNWDNLDSAKVNLPYKMKIDGTENKLVAKVNCSELVYDKEWLYFVSPEGGKFPIFKMKTDGTQITALNHKVYSHFLNVAGDYIFYWNIDDGKLYRMSLDGTENKVLLNKRVDFVNAAGDWVYFSNASDGYNLYKVKNDGTQLQKLSDIPPDRPELPSYIPDCIFVINDTAFYRAFHSELTGDALFYIPANGTERLPWDAKEAVF